MLTLDQAQIAIEYCEEVLVHTWETTCELLDILGEINPIEIFQFCHRYCDEDSRYTLGLYTLVYLQCYTELQLDDVLTVSLALRRPLESIIYELREILPSEKRAVYARDILSYYPLRRDCPLSFVEEAHYRIGTILG